MHSEEGFLAQLYLHQGAWRRKCEEVKARMSNLFYIVGHIQPKVKEV